MNKTKKLISFAILSTALAAACVGCASGGSSSVDPGSSTPGGSSTPSSKQEEDVIVQLSLMNSTNENPGWLAMIDAANEVLAANNDHVIIQPEIIKTDSWDKYYTKITTNLLGHVGGTIGRIAESHVPVMIANDQAADVTDLVNDLIATGDFTDNVFEGVAKVDNRYYGIPTGTQPMVLYYNKTIFDEYNKAHPSEPLSYPSSDWTNASTFEEIRNMASKLTSGTGSAKKFGISAGPYLGFGGMYSKNSGGENILNAAGECCIDSQPFYDVYNWFADMLITDKSMPSTTDTAVLDSMSRFLNGNIAMIIDGVWQIHDVCKYTEDYEIGVAAIPVYDKQYKSYSTTFADRFWAASNSLHPEADKKALKALMSVEAVKALAEKGVGGIPVRKDSVDTFLNTIEDSKIGDYVDCIKDGVKNRISIPYTTYYNRVDQIINQKMSTWINGKMTTVDFVKFMDKTMKDGMAGKL